MQRTTKEESNDLKHQLALLKNDQSVKINTLEQTIQILTKTEQQKEIVKISQESGNNHSLLIEIIKLIYRHSKNITGVVRSILQRVEEEYKYTNNKLITYKNELKEKSAQVIQLHRKLLKSEHKNLQTGDQDILTTLSSKCEKQAEEIIQLEQQVKDLKNKNMTDSTSVSTFVQPENSWKISEELNRTKENEGKVRKYQVTLLLTTININFLD